MFIFIRGKKNYIEGVGLKLNVKTFCDWFPGIIKF